MIRNDFSPKSLLQVLSRHEIIKFSLGKGSDDYKEKLDEISKSLYTEGFFVDLINKRDIRGKLVYSAEYVEEHLALKKINFDIKRIYKIKHANRDEITEQVLKVLETSSAYGIIKIDIKSFYESVLMQTLIEKLQRDKLINSNMTSILSDIEQLTNAGLPRGLSICSALSELYMRDIDSKIRELNGVYYYSRYVDDLLIITTTRTELIYKTIIEILLKKNLEINDKSLTHDIDSIGPTHKKTSFDYLGYKYTVYNKSFNSKRVIDVTLADDKVRKIKTRIIHALLDRALSNNYSKRKLLEKRIRILAGNYPITSSNESGSVLKGGIFYSNRLVNKPGVFKEFNDFLRKSLYCTRNSFFGRAMKKIGLTEKEMLCEICFKEGFEKKTFIDVSNTQMQLIKKCWSNKNHKRKK